MTIFTGQLDEIAAPLRLLKVNEIFLVAPAWLLRRAQSGAAATTETAALAPAISATDAQLVARFAAGDGDALALIYNRHAPALFRVLSAILGSPADAEDSLQETFVALATLAQSPRRARAIRDLRAYLLTAARHQALSVLRRRKRENGWEDVSALEIAAPETPDSPHDFAALLARLPLEQREVIALKVWEGLTFTEIASIIQISPNTAQSRYRYGIERLRGWCEEENRD